MRLTISSCCVCDGCHRVTADGSEVGKQALFCRDGSQFFCMPPFRGAFARDKLPDNFKEINSFG